MTKQGEGHAPGRRPPTTGGLVQHQQNQKGYDQDGFRGRKQHGEHVSMHSKCTSVVQHSTPVPQALTERQTDGHADRQTGRQADGQTDSQTRRQERGRRWRGEKRRVFFFFYHIPSALRRELVERERGFRMMLMVRRVSARRHVLACKTTTHTHTHTHTLSLSLSLSHALLLAFRTPTAPPTSRPQKPATTLSLSPPGERD